MGRFDGLEEIEALREYMKVLLKDFHVNSYRDIIFAIIVLGQYFLYTFYDERCGKTDNRKFYATGVDCVRKLNNVNFIYLLAQARNLIVHGPRGEALKIAKELCNCWNKFDKSWMDSLDSDIWAAITYTMQADKEWDKLFKLLEDTSEENDGFLAGAGFMVGI